MQITGGADSIGHGARAPTTFTNGHGHGGKQETDQIVLTITKALT